MKVNGYNLDVVCTNCCGDIYVNLEVILKRKLPLDTS